MYSCCKTTFAPPCIHLQYMYTLGTHTHLSKSLSLPDIGQVSMLLINISTKYTCKYVDKEFLNPVSVCVSVCVCVCV